MALRVLTLFEVLVRRGQNQSGEKLKGLYPGQPKRVTNRPTAQRVLEAIARKRITLSRVESADENAWHPGALPGLVSGVLEYLGLADIVYI
jgi:hypothetical protein